MTKSLSFQTSSLFNNNRVKRETIDFYIFHHRRSKPIIEHILFLLCSDENDTLCVESFPIISIRLMILSIYCQSNYTVSLSFIYSWMWQCWKKFPPLLSYSKVWSIQRGIKNVILILWCNSKKVQLHGPTLFTDKPHQFQLCSFTARWWRIKMFFQMVSSLLFYVSVSTSYETHVWWHVISISLLSIALCRSNTNIVKNCFDSHLLFSVK